MSNQCIAMLLAGGRGSRLGSLTKNIAKPAVPFGGKYRIIDFVLSNCRNSKIDTVGVLTQYQPHILHEYIGDGHAWDLNHRYSGLKILPPYRSDDREKWYEGTAHAIYQNIEFIDRYNPDHILILSGDHIYKMDYQRMLYQHIQNDADATIATIRVPIEQANRFGIMSVDCDQRIYDFEEKPIDPKSDLASMGVYIFNWKLLRRYLYEGAGTSTELKDFGKDVIPQMLNERHRLFSYNFSGYWKDVGTVHSYWEANMDLLSRQSILFNNRSWQIFTVEQCIPPFFIDNYGNVKQSIIADGCEIAGEVENCVLSYDVKIGRGSVIQNSVILPNTEIGSNVFIKNSVVGSHISIADGTVFQQNFHLNEVQLIDENIHSLEPTTCKQNLPIFEREFF